MVCVLIVKKCNFSCLLCHPVWLRRVLPFFRHHSFIVYCVFGYGSLMRVHYTKNAHIFHIVNSNCISIEEDNFSV